MAEIRQSNDVARRQQGREAGVCSMRVVATCCFQGIIVSGGEAKVNMVHCVLSNNSAAGVSSTMSCRNWITNECTQSY